MRGGDVMMTEAEQNKKLDELEKEVEEINAELCKKEDKIAELAEKLEEAETVIDEACVKLRYYRPFKRR